MRQFSYPNSQFTNILGGASIGWKLNVYDTGTTNKASIYSDLGQTIPTANPVIADADGFLASFYWTGTVDVVLTDENDNLIDSANGIQDLVSTINAVVVAEGVTLPFGTASGSGDTIIATLPITSDFSDGGVFIVRANAANTGAANTPNLQVNSYASRRIKKIGGVALIANDIVSGMNMILVYNLAQDCYYLINHESTFLKRDGTAAMLGTLDMGSHKVSSVLSGTAKTDAPNIGQVQDNSTQYAVAGGSPNALTLTLSPALTAYVNGQRINFNALSTNTGAATITVNGLSALTMTRVDGSPMQAGDIQASTIYEIIVSGSNAVVQGVGEFVVGQCQLTMSGGYLILSRFNGYKLFINNALRIIPATPLSLNSAVLTINTTYYIYAYMSGATMTLEASATVPAEYSVNGVKIKNGDSSRTLVGMGRTDGAAWAICRSWFNDTDNTSSSYYTADRSTNSTAGFAEVNSEIRAGFLVWDGQPADISVNGGTLLNMGAGDGGYAYYGIAIDGASPQDNGCGIIGVVVPGNYTSQDWLPLGISVSVGGLSEGYHYATVSGVVVHTEGSGGLLYFSGSGTSGRRTSLTVKT